MLIWILIIVVLLIIVVFVYKSIVSKDNGSYSELEISSKSPGKEYSQPAKKKLKAMDVLPNVTAIKEKKNLIG